MKRRYGDQVFKGIAYFFGLAIIGLLVLMLWEMYKGSSLAINKFGLGFILGRTWDPVSEQFGAWPFIYGTIVSSIMALIIATPISVGIAIFLVEIAPKWFQNIIGFLIELLAAIPSIIYGLWGIFILGPIVRDHIAPIFINTLGTFIPFFNGPSFGVGIFTAGVILAIMIIPTIAAISREVLLVVPDSQREAALALGATKWEMIRKAVLTYARSGIMGGMIIGLGRAIGETMSVTMVIGNRPEIPKSIFDPAYTMASVIANEFTEASSNLYLSALIEVGLLLFGVTLVVNMLARLLVWSTSRGVQEAK
ncbi:phosphate ABC transporter permease subunit PstC [Aneurinibacillus sp. Ricciae_BoGa-3]|uniref:phosphate ABC transporter permease subunit PstC n=1 Tax=Aneurinibacillus sp. Ricciae_BoGa-3 TaxID=3022697 RepID=UPI0023411604|nr:phosphate ABC transporter permease subunit PstC [Aneurinibacillus sp. Ricciae_BoGa-3]WCK54656.1 phosphate ABC transporter permease subunit PstC [Aneurinibacillus sp. Ricciae_BoGa-3]